MTTVEITLPDQLAEEARRAGLLSPPAVEAWLREQLRIRQADDLFAAIDRMAAVSDPEAMTAAEIADEIRALRAERRATSGH